MKKGLKILFLILAGTIQSQEKLDLSYYLPEGVTYDQSIPTPKSIIGHEVGEWHITHDKLVSYMQAVAAASNRVSIEYRGKTFEGRPLLLLKVTAPENHNNLDAIRKQHLQLTERGGENLDTSSMPTVVYQGFSIHGNEPSGSNASLAVIYHLAAAKGSAIESLLKNVVILFDPSFNPDGLQRFSHWANSNKSLVLNPDPNDREYSEGWPRGRTNHYHFDLNRDWMPSQLPESRARIKSFHQWKPNILTDHHEMGTNSTFFFQPGIQSRVHPLTPKMNQELTKKIGTYHVKALDKIGSLYYTEEDYDDFYYGKGSSFPDINGGIGILFEQASSRGHAQETESGVLTFPFTIRNQFVTALSTLEAAYSMRVELLNYQRDFYQESRNKSSKEMYVFGNKEDKSRTYHLAEILKRHQIKFYKPASSITKNGTTFNTETSFVVPVHQKEGKLVKAMFEKRTSFQDSLFYDISAWTLPLAFNLNYQKLTTPASKGELVTEIQLPQGKVTTKSEYAYLMEWHEYYTPKALNKLLQKGIKAKVGLQPFTLAGKKYDYGTIMIPVQGQDFNSQQLFEILQKISSYSSVVLQGVPTGLTPLGIDLGSRNFKALKKQKVAIVVGDGVSSYDAGEIWHLFDQRYQMKITKLDTRNLRRTDLSKYTTIILPSAGSLNESVVKNIKDWVQRGGTLIGYKNAVKLLASKKFIKLDFKSTSLKAEKITFEQRSKFSGAQVIGGAIFEAKIDRSHPINFGYTNSKIPLFRKTKVMIEKDSMSYNNPIQYTQNPLLSGYISEENLELLKNSVPFQVKRLGKGKVVVFTDNTNFRAFWYGTNKLLMNAVFFSKFM